MTPTEYLRSHPIHAATRLSDLRRAYAAAGGEIVNRTMFVVALIQAGYGLDERDGRGSYVLPRSVKIPASTSDGWIGPHLRP